MRGERAALILGVPDEAAASMAAAAGTELAGAAYCDTVIVLNMTIGNNVDLHYSRLLDRSPSGIVFTEGNFL